MKTGPYVVGRGSYPNSEGTVQLDAAIMRGRDCSIGAVCGLEGSVQPLQDAATLVVQLCHVLSHRYSKPIQVARHIMVHSPHNVLVGSGAGKYAIENGFKMESNNALLGPEAVQAYQVTYQLQSVYLQICMLASALLYMCEYYAERALLANVCFDSGLQDQQEQHHCWKNP